MTGAVELPVQAVRRWAIVATLMLLPIDWFKPTGLLLREAGAKPATPFLAVLLLGIVLSGGRALAISGPARRFLSACLLVGCAGGFAFGLNLMLGWSPFDWDRSPIAQFVAQMAMFGMFVIVLLCLLQLLDTPDARAYALRALPWVAAAHLAILGLEAAHLLDGNPVLLLFRTDNGLFIRASGLMSEPSYYGTFAALFGVPLLASPAPGRLVQRVLGLTLLVTAYLVQAKTMFVVLAAQSVYLLLAPHRHRLTRPLLLVALGVLAVAAVSLVQTSAADDLEANLSTAMRVGSTGLSLNVASAGYGVPGLGFGQFHFFYTPRFAPDFLFLSQEAQDQFTHVSPQRASSYNLLTRMLVETGVTGFLAFFGAIAAVVWRCRAATDEATRTGLLFIFGSIGFLTSQDTYCYPPLAFGLALALAGHAPSPVRARTVLSPAA